MHKLSPKSQQQGGWMANKKSTARGYIHYRKKKSPSKPSRFVREAQERKEKEDGKNLP